MIVENPENAIDTILNAENEIIKKISYEFPYLKNVDLKKIAKLTFLSEAIFTTPNNIRTISYFSKESAPRIEAELLKDIYSYIDFEENKTKTENAYLDKKLEETSLLYGFHKTSFYPTEFSFTTGWNFQSVLATILYIRDRMPDNAQKDIYSIIDFAIKNNPSKNETQAVTLYQDVVVVETGLAIKKQIYSLFSDLINQIPRLEFLDSAVKIGNILNIPNDLILTTISEVEKDFLARQ